MSTIRGLENYSDKYRAFGEKILNETSAMLERSGINVFPQNTVQQNDNTDSCVITKMKAPELQKESKPESKKTGASWIREAMPTHKDPSSMLSSAMNNCQTYIAKSIDEQNNQSSSGEETEDIIDDSVEDDANCIKKLANSGSDEGDGNLLQTFLEKDVKAGFHSSNFLGTNNKSDIVQKTGKDTAVAFSDNLYNKGNTSVIFGGTAAVVYSKTDDSDSKNYNYNAYAYGKYKTNKFTYGIGGMDTNSDGVNYINISAGVKHNDTGLYAIIEKDINIVPGLPTQTVTNVNVGIGKNSGQLDPDSYKHDTSGVENIEDIDNAAEYVEGKESDASKMADDNNKENTIINLIISDSDNTKEYGVKGGYIFRKAKNNNYAFIMPYGQISNTNINSQEGLKLILGTSAGQNITTSNGWNIKTKGTVECSRQVTTGQCPSDYVLANINFKAGKNNFSGEIGAGGYYDNNSTFSKYAELKVGYQINDSLAVGLKGGIAHYQYNADDENKKAEFAVNVSYNF